MHKEYHYWQGSRSCSHPPEEQPGILKERYWYPCPFSKQLCKEVKGCLNTISPSGYSSKSAPKQANISVHNTASHKHSVAMVTIRQL